MTKLLVKLWHLIRGPLQWYVLWAFHNKFIIGVSGVVFNNRGEVLLLRHKYWEKGSWGLPSGYAIRNEKVEDTLKREVKEETNLDIEVVKQVQLVSGYKLRIEISMHANLLGGNLSLDKKEVIEAKFFPIDKLPSELIESHRDIIKIASKS